MKSAGPMSFTAGLAEFFGPLEMDEGASLECAAGARMKLGGGASHKIAGQGMSLYGDLDLGFGEIAFDAPLLMLGADALLDIDGTSEV